MIVPGTLLVVQERRALETGLYALSPTGEVQQRMCNLIPGTLLLVLFDEGDIRAGMMLVLVGSRLGWVWRDNQLLHEVTT